MKWITSVDWLECNVTNLPSVKNLSAFQCIVSRKSNTFEVGSLTCLLRCLGSFLGMVTVDHWWFSEPCGTIFPVNPCKFAVKWIQPWKWMFNVTNSNSGPGRSKIAHRMGMNQTKWSRAKKWTLLGMNMRFRLWILFRVFFGDMCCCCCFFKVICSHAQWVHFDLSLEPKLFGKRMQHFCACSEKNPAHQHAFLRFKTAENYIWPRWVAQTLNKFWWY